MLRIGAGLFRTAPVVPLIAIVPEFSQHVVEIGLGMFASRAAFARHAFDPLRWQFGYVKLAGFWLAVIGAVLLSQVPRIFWDHLRQTRWQRLVVAIGLNALIVAAAVYLPQDGAWMVLQVVLSIAGAPLLVYLVGALLGDSSMSLFAAYTRGWRKVLRSVLLVVPVFAGCQLLHGLHHKLALGQPTALVWLLMGWDALWVGLMACWIGTGCALGYGATGLEHRPRDGRASVLNRD